MPTDGYKTHLAALRTLGGRRVWSLMISLFGDLAQAEGETIDGPVLSNIMEPLDAKPEAVRVALHRLRNDGWITSTKSGRISSHALSAKGRAESIAASPRIYAKPGGTQGAWQVVLTQDASAEAGEGFTPLAPRIFVGAATLATPENALVLQGNHVPDWLRSQAEPAHLRGEYRALQHTLAALQDALPVGTTLPPNEIAAMRCLIVHNWRRLVLKHPALPADLTSAEWPGQKCHVLVNDLLAQFPRPSLIQIDQRHAA
jgi:phenylacetic acid degradation operon negative regulatory protein